MPVTIVAVIGRRVVRGLLTSATAHSQRTASCSGARKRFRAVYGPSWGFTPKPRLLRACDLQARLSPRGSYPDRRAIPTPLAPSVPELACADARYSQAAYLSSPPGRPAAFLARRKSTPHLERTSSTAARSSSSSHRAPSAKPATSRSLVTAGTACYAASTTPRPSRSPRAASSHDPRHSRAIPRPPAAFGEPGDPPIAGHHRRRSKRRQGTGARNAAGGRTRSSDHDELSEQFEHDCFRRGVAVLPMFASATTRSPASSRRRQFEIGWTSRCRTA